MAFPVSLASSLSISGTQPLSTYSHGTGVHVEDRNDIIALGRKLGLGTANAVASGTVALLGTGGTQSAWGQITNAYISGTANIAVSKLATGTKGYALLAGASSPTYEPISRKNFIINGDFRVSQRYAVNTGLAVIDNTIMMADKWRMLYDSASNAPSTYNSTSFFGSTAGASFNTLTCQASNAATGRHGMFHAIESKDTGAIRGRAVSLSFLAFAQPGFSDIRAAILYWTGTADAVSSDPVATWSSLASGTPGNASGLSGSWLFANTPANLSVTSSATVCKIENVSIPQSATNVAVLIWCEDTTTTFGEFWGIQNVQLERGSVCTEFEARPYNEEFALCGAAGTAGLLHSSSIGVPSYSTVGTSDLAANAVTQTMGTTAFVDNPTTTSNTFVDMTAMVGTLVTTGGDLIAMFTGVTTNNVAGKYVAVGFALDGADTVDIVVYTPPTGGYYGNTGCFYRWTSVSAGTHTVKSRWRSDSGGTASIFGRSLMLMELKR